ncbi:hypothetical protein J3Q07_16505 [Pseudomonas sp. D4-18]|uniref:hypothetical protein n=1 Tax=Pseudomonas sp. D4-18 TaxID=2817395 RepID=UPI003DA7CD73
MTDKMREEFEACLLDEFVLDLKKKADFPAGMAEAVVKEMLFERREDGEYASVVPRERWIGWRTSREALVIELPDHHCYDRPGEAYPVIQDCREAIEAAGLKVKP